MKYYKTCDGYIAVDPNEKLRAGGCIVPNSTLVYGRGPTRNNAPESVESKLFDTRTLSRCLEMRPEDVPKEWRLTLGLVKVDSVPPPTNTVKLPKLNWPLFIFGLLCGFSIARLMYKM
jgi:hypothetical protein